MDRIEVNDFVMTAYTNALRMTGQHKLAESTEKIYEVQRAEIIASEAK